MCHLFTLLDGGALLREAANHLPFRGDVPGNGELIAFHAFGAVLRIGAVVVGFNVVFDIGTEYRRRQQQAFIQQLPFGAGFAGFRFCGLKSVRLALLPVPPAASAKLLPPGGCWEMAS